MPHDLLENFFELDHVYDTMVSIKTKELAEQDQAQAPGAVSRKR